MCGIFATNIDLIFKTQSELYEIAPNIDFLGSQSHVTVVARPLILYNNVVGVIFADFRKAFDAIPHSILLQKLQGLGVVGDLWCWIRDYLSGRTQVTMINGCQSQAMPVSFGVLQGSVLGRTLFSLFCNDLRDITEGIDGNSDSFICTQTIRPFMSQLLLLIWWHLS